jgi:hypothetical protein
MNSTSNRDRFEQAWQRALSDAEKAPPPSVWQKVEAGLATGEASMYRRRLVYFKWVAAASVLLSIGMGLYIWHGQYDAGHTPIASMHEEGREGQGTARELSADQGTTEISDPGQALAYNRENAAGRSGSAGAVERAGQRFHAANDARPGTTAAVIAVSQRDADPGAYAFSTQDSDNRAQTSVYRTLPVAGRQLGIRTAISTLPVPADQIYRTPTMLPRARKDNAPLQLLAGLNFSTGRFDPGYEAAGPAIFQPPALASFETLSYRNVSDNMANNASEVSGESYAPSASFAYGMNFGARVGNHWIVQTGLKYIYANSWARTSAFYQDPATMQRTAVLRPINYSTEGVVQVVQTDRVQLKNAFEFISIPLQAGYIVFDRVIDMSLLAGLSADFLVGNAITDQGGMLQDFNTGRGQDSPYRSIYYNGSLSTALGAVIGQRYRITVEPGYRMALSDLTKESFSLNSRPSAFYVSFGINYRFR